MKIVVFGAGNIGRSFVGQLFARAGYRVVFVDVDRALVEALNREGRYRIEVRDRNPETIWVEGVSALDGRDVPAVARELATADIAATAVGPQALPFIYPAIASGLMLRLSAGAPPLDIIICENLRGAAGAVRRGLKELLPAGFPLEERAGLIETSIGKMVPIMPDEVRRRDPLLLYAEAYNTLILDAKAFRNPIPDVPGLDPKQNMAAYVDRKAFIHNCGHAASAYLGYLAHPTSRFLWEVIEDERVRELARRAMWESARTLIKRYPGEFTEQNQHEHIEDLLSRFANQALGDTVYRVGRDLPRKLSRDDRMVGALLMDEAEGVEAPYTTLATAAGFLFRATGEHGELYPADARFAEELESRGADWALAEVCGLQLEQEPDSAIAGRISLSLRQLAARGEDWPQGALSA
ncbi:MAG: mannitol-1-phosphate 5-dehydrogenase [Armatimonadota bacterium]